jgi:ferritin-like metal-binding protein YciE
MATANDTIQDIFLVAVRNAHALEKEALQIMGRQVERLSNYPEMEMVLRRHIDETKQQEQRIDEILDALGSERSLLKDLATSIVGNMAAISHAPMPDEILKNTFANHAFENFEIAAYKSLIAMAETAGHQRFIPALQQSLKEEESTARQINELIVPITQKYLLRAGQGEKADR